MGFGVGSNRGRGLDEGEILEDWDLGRIGCKWLLDDNGRLFEDDAKCGCACWPGGLLAADPGADPGTDPGGSVCIALGLLLGPRA